MNEFLGEFPHSLDDKGRLILPAKFRAPLETGAVIAAGQGKCLAVFTPTEWEHVAQQTREMAKGTPGGMAAARAVFALASHVAPDKQGRVSIPPPLREYAGLDREVVVAGALTRVEIWDASRWHEERAAGEALLADNKTLPGIF